MNSNISKPLDDQELARLDEFLLERMDDETADRIDAAGGDEGIIDISELDGFLTAIVSGPSVIVPSKWLPAVWGDEAPVWESMEQYQEIFELIIRHMNCIAAMLIHAPDDFEPMFEEREVEGKTHNIVDEWCCGYMRGIALDADAWIAAEPDISALLGPIRLWGTEEGWKRVDKMKQAERVREQNSIAGSVRALHAYWLKRRTPQPGPVRRAAPKVGRNDPCPCGSGKKYKHCCLQ